MWWLLVALAALGPVQASAGPDAGQVSVERKTPQPPSQKPVDFRNPPRRFDRRKIHGWNLLVENSLVAREPDLLARALSRLDAKLGEALAILPRSSHRELKGLTLMILHGPQAEGGGRDNGLEFFTRDAPRHNPQLDPRMANCVAIYSALNFTRISDLWALKALVHEFAHAHHLLRWPEDQPEITSAWRNAMDRGLYRNVRDEEGKLLPSAWATVNQLEYFAEVSVMYFARCNYYPHDRKELAEHDPVGYRLVQRMWGVHDQ